MKSRSVFVFTLYICQYKIMIIMCRYVISVPYFTCIAISSKKNCNVHHVTFSYSTDNITSRRSVIFLSSCHHITRLCGVVTGDVISTPKVRRPKNRGLIPRRERCLSFLRSLKNDSEVTALWVIYPFPRGNVAGA